MKPIILALAVAPLLLSLGACEADSEPDRRSPMQEMPMGGMHGGMMGDRMPEWMMSTGSMDPQMMRDMPVIHSLLTNHEKIQRQVDDIPGGVRTVTISKDPEIASLIQTHVWQMKDRVEEGRPIRMMDPVFREIFRNHGKIEMSIENIPGGVRITETSEDPQVVLLIRQHAHRAVSEFVRYGMERARQPTELPPGYRRN